MTSPHAEGGANHAQRRRYTNMELLLYGQEAVHLTHLATIQENNSDIQVRAICIIQNTWRMRAWTKVMLQKAKGLKLKSFRRG